MQVDRATSNKGIAEDTTNQIKSRREQPAKQSASDLVVVTKAAAKDSEGQSTSLNNFRETLKDVLEEITSLEVNTMIVGNIPMKKFDAKEFYQDLSNNIKYKTEEGLQNVKESLLERSTQLKQKGFSLPQQTSTPLLPKEAAVIEQYRAELTRYNQDLEVYKESEFIFNERKNSLDPQEKAKFIAEESCYIEMSRQLMKLDIKTDADGEVIVDAQMIRYFRKLWEFEQSVLNGDRIYAQTKFHLDGDLTNRFIEDLFTLNKSKIDPKMTQLIFDLHRQGVENAQKQWSGLIETCVNLVKSLMPFRSK
ncbi:hypothetical protein [Pseudanabaena sp. Chao 1811]|uniref:hypothetical protein n=1 Tax=Pseudanabaena sp. Chao 1811 TaxID=2963092 RepID=UPI0022F3B13E|nr:hypothetical protein [Pseudanabaena sp. Chao 1811]